MMISGISGQSADPIDPFPPFVSYNFVQSSQNIEENSKLELRDIFYYVSILNLTGNPVQGTEKQLLIERVQSYQNADGGFGDWYNDRSKAGTTHTALETLEALGAGPRNRTGAIQFIGRLQVNGLEYGNFGFRSSLKERDADISSTYDSLGALSSMEAAVPNIDQVRFYVRDHQNTDGGFGYQTNRRSGIIWESTMIHTQRGLLSLSQIGGDPDFRTEAVNFIRSNQDTTGGFGNYPGDSAQIAYTYNAITALEALGEPIPRIDDILEFISTKQMENGGFIEYDLDLKEGLHTTYFALMVLEDLGGSYDKAGVMDFARTYFDDRADGGFGDYPGLASTSRITFDAVSVLNRIGKAPIDSEAVRIYLDALRNSDGGYGFEGRSNMETTYRTVISYQMLGIPIPDPGSAIDYTRNLQNNDGGFGFARGYVSRGAYTYRAVRTLDILGREPFDIQGAIDFLRSLQNSDGGFGNYFGEGDSDLTSTYRAVRGLEILGSGPSNRNSVLEFIRGSRNEDGGFRRSPSDITAPGNFSTSLFTYDAVLSLYFLDEEITDKLPIYEFIRSLRNPDLGFGEKEFFTSRVSDTFTSIWSYMVLYRSSLDPPPSLGNLTIDPAIPRPGISTRMTIEYHDPGGQNPEYIHAVIDDERFLMQPIGTWTYSVDIQLSSGDHDLRIEASDGLNDIVLHMDQLRVQENEGAPEILVDIIPQEGLDDTEFTIEISYEHPQSIPPERVEVQIDGGDWIEVPERMYAEFSHRAYFKAGIHQVRARGFDGVNYGYSEKISGPVVYSSNSSRPDWDTFLKIRQTILREKGANIDYRDVERAIYGGALAWKVETGHETVYVNYDGDDLMNGNGEARSIWPLVATVSIIPIILGILGTVGYVLYRNRSEAKEDEGEK
ncbi:MAG: prenyltransferase/squalene oxidase repeat-containing protein [Thermoplasmatota archaeon]